MIQWKRTEQSDAAILEALDSGSTENLLPSQKAELRRGQLRINLKGLVWPGRKQ